MAKFLTIEELIKHCEEVAEEQEKKAKALSGDFYQSRRNACIECASEHRQLAELLRELKQRRDADKITRAELDGMIEEVRK